jgi:thiamine pyrophosphate-dependent acetolactate synthase large subunit-like protein
MGEADVIVGFGCSYTTWTTRQETLFAPDAVVVQVDTQPTALGASARVDVEVLGDCEATARDVLDHLRLIPDRSGRWRSQEVGERIAGQRRPEPPASAPAPDTVHPKDLSLALDDLLPGERTVVIDGGHFLGWPATCWSVPDPHGFVFSSAGFQSIGLGLAAAVGAQLARPDRLTALGVGDGGFLMSVSELETLVRLDLPVLVVVYNDAAYSAEVHHFGRAGVGMDLVQFPPTDIAALARGAGANGVTVRQMSDLDAVATWIAEPHGPLVVDAKIDPTVVGYWAEQDFQGH